MGNTIQASTEALQTALAALRNLGGGLAAHRGEVRRRIAPGLDALADVQARAVSRLESAEATLATAQSVEVGEGEDSPDCSGLEEAVDRARGEVKHIEAVARRGRSLLDEAIAAERQAMLLVDSEVPEALAFVRDSLGRLRDLQSLSLGPDRTAGSSSIKAFGSDTQGDVNGGDVGGAPKKSQPPRTLELIGTRLPAGFEWIPVSKIVESSDFREEELHFKNAAPEEFFELFSRFRGRVIPIMQVYGERANSNLQQTDTLEQSFDGKSLVNAYSIFFGDNPITVNKTNNGIVNGRHRIWAARELGWSHVPARILR